MVLLVAWLAVTTVGRTGENSFVLEVPATYLSVGQQFQPRLVSLAESAAVPDAEVTLELVDADGQSVASQQIALAATATVEGQPMALPRAGTYRLRARAAPGSQSIALQALPEPAQSYGGVLPLAALGLDTGIADYLRQHSFAVHDFGSGADAPLIVLGDARLDGGDLAAKYGALWQRVGGGATVLALQPPPPGVTDFWPITTRLTAAPHECSEDVFDPPLAAGLVTDTALEELLQPALVYDLTRSDPPDVYRWDGRLILRPNPQGGYPGCHALFSFRYGEGWVTVSTLPLLQHFQDVRARIYLMNLIEASRRRKHPVPAAPGLEWVTQQRLKKLSAVGSSPADVAAVFYRPPPAAVEPAPELVPPASDGDPKSCWLAPPGPQAGAILQLDLLGPQPVRTLSLVFGAVAPLAFDLEASPDGRNWSPLPVSTPVSGGDITLALPSGDWQAFRLTIAAGAPARAWQLCRFAAQ